MSKKFKIITFVLVIILSVLLLKNLFSGKIERSSTNFDERYGKYLGDIELTLKPDAYAPNDSNDAVSQYAEMLEISKTYLKAKQLCLKSMIKFHPIIIVKQQKLTSYWGVRVGTDEWKEIIEAYNTYATNVCSSYSGNEMQNIFINELNSRLSLKEKDQLHDFYESELGKKIINATVLSNHKMMELTYKNQATANAKYSKIYNARVEEIYQKTLDKSPFGWFVRIINKIR